MYRLLATDIDDTLLDPDGALPAVNRESLRDLAARGVAVVLTSGRAVVSTRMIAERIFDPEADEYLICFNGAVVTTTRSRKLISSVVLDREVVARVAHYAREQDLVLQAYGRDDFVVERDHELSRRYARDTDMQYRIVKNLAELDEGGTPKLLLIGDHDALAEHQRELSRLAPQASVMFSKPRYLEIVGEGIAKGSALRALAAKLDIPIEETLAIGDSLNDLSMIEAAGLGVAVANARSEVKEAADVVTERSAAEGAVSEVVARFFSA